MIDKIIIEYCDHHCPLTHNFQNYIAELKDLTKDHDYIEVNSTGCKKRCGLRSSIDVDVIEQDKRYNAALFNKYESGGIQFIPKTPKKFVQKLEEFWKQYGN
jgi:hypothetical protein